MKLFFILAFVFISSCTSTQSPGVVSESTQIVGEYVDTLENSVENARSVVEMMNKKTEERNSEINK